MTSSEQPLPLGLSTGVNSFLSVVQPLGLPLRVSKVERESRNKKQLPAWFVKHAKHNSNKNSNELIIIEMVSLAVQMPIIYVARLLMEQGIL